MGKEIIRLEGIKKSYGQSEVLKGIDLSVNESEVVVLLGPSGTGKSTLLRCINLLTVPTEGHVWVSGQELTAPKVNINHAREHLGMVFQEFNLFAHLRAIDNVAVGLTKVLGVKKAEAQEKARIELERVGLGDKLDLYPGQRQGPVHGPGGHALRRAPLGPGPGAYRRSTGGHAEAGPGGHDYGLRDP